MVAGAGLLLAGPSVYAASLPTAQLAQSHPAMQQMLRFGDQSHWVMTLQADLNLLGYPETGPVDGIFGPKTQSGVLAFQRAHHLAATGMTDMATWQDILAGFHLVPTYQGTDAQQSIPAATAPAAHTATTAAPSHGMIDGHPIVATYHMIATAYGPSLKDNYPYGPVDAFGQPLQAGMIAVDPSVIPLKSQVYVTGYTDQNLPSGGFLGQAMDTGGAIQGNRIDVFMNANPRTVSNFGIEPVTVYVLGK